MTRPKRFLSFLVEALILSHSFIECNPFGARRMEKTRIELLEETLESNPDNAFVRYALALELANADSPDSAWKHFELLLQRHPEYSATYYQAGKFLAKQERKDEARRVIARGIEVTRSQGNLHAQSELETALAELGAP